jgi:signal transduction histidine kinase
MGAAGPGGSISLTYITRLLQNDRVVGLLILEFLLLALVMALNEWRHGTHTEARRLSTTFAALAALRLPLLIPGLPQAFPPAYSLIEGFSLILLAWSFSRSAFHNHELADRLRNILLLLAGLAAGIWGALWLWPDGTRDSPVEWSTIVWHLATAGLAGVTTWFLAVSRREHRALLSLAFGLLTLGHAGVVLGYPIALRASGALVYPLFTLAIYQTITGDLRAYGSELRSLSRRSLDHTKERILLLELSRLARSPLDELTLLKVVADYSGPVFNLDGLVVLLKEEGNGSEGWPVAARYQSLNAQLPETAQTHVYPDQLPPLKDAVAEGRQVLLTAPEMDEADNRIRIALQELLGQAPLGEVLIQPMLAGEQVMGALIGSRLAGHPTFTNEEFQLFEAVAALSAATLHHLRTFQNLIQAHAHLQSLNAQLQDAYQHLQDLDRLKSAFLGLVTHELRSPFAGIDLSLQVLKRYSKECPEPVREQFAQLELSIHEASGKVDALVSFASLLGRQELLTTALLDFAEVVDQVVLVLGPLAQSRRVILRVSGGRPVIIEGNLERLREALQHLVHNAIKFNKPGGQVFISYGIEGDMLTCQVRDTGPGIPPEQLSSIWQGFYQASDPVRRGVEGLGLGLALVKLIIESHHGEVSAESTPGEGSTFRFRIPLRQPARVEQADDRPPTMNDEEA